MKYSTVQGYRHGQEDSGDDVTTYFFIFISPKIWIISRKISEQIKIPMRLFGNLRGQLDIV